MKRMLSLLCLASVLVAAPVLATPGDKCGCNANKPRAAAREEAADKCGCNANKPKGGATKSCGSCNSCNSCNNKPCCGR